MAPKSKNSNNIKYNKKMTWKIKEKNKNRDIGIVCNKLISN